MRKNMFGLILAALAVVGCGSTAADRGPPAEDFDATWQDGRWAFSNGPEFPGAAGRFDRAAEAAHGGRWGGRLTFDFTGGGNYVAAVLRLEKAPEVAAVRLWIRKPGKNRLTFRYTDPTGQTLQRGFDAPADRWADVTVPMAGWTGHWGGANDGVPHGPPRLIAFLVENTGLAQGEVLFDDVRLVEGKPGEGAGMITSQYVAGVFGGDEPWTLQAHGDAGASKLEGATLRFDFSKGASAIGVAPKEYSLLGVPQEIRIRVRGQAAGHPVRLLLATHFMMFEKTVGEFAKDGENEIVVPAPPGEGWRWFGGENDGKLHGPLRIRGILLDGAGRKDAGQLELVDVRVKTACAPERAMVLVAALAASEKGPEFAAAIRSLAPSPIKAVVPWTIRDWGGKTVAEGRAKVTVPPAAAPAVVRVPMPRGAHLFLEAEFAVEAEGQMVPPAYACHVAPIEPMGSAVLEPESPFGMGLYLYRYPNNAQGLKEMERAAQLAQDAGVKWSREEFGWAGIEPRRGEFDWSFYDQLVATARRHGISLYGLLSYWSNWTKPYTEEGIEDYARYAAAAAARYRQDIRHWEVWNEPNIFFWQGPPDLYAELLKRAYDAIKKANPDAAVLGCSTAGIDEKFIRRSIELGAPFDLLTIHPYRAVLKDRPFIAELKRVAQIARRPDGAVRPSWITEMGWATHVPHNGSTEGFAVTTQREQAQLLARAYIDAIASGVAPNISWYDFRNDGDDPFNFEHHMGILTRDFEPKPAYRAYATLTRLLRHKKPAGELPLGSGVAAFPFADAGGGPAVIALWSVDGDRTVQVPCPSRAVLTDLMGNTRMLDPADGKVGVPLRLEAPVFLAPAPGPEKG